MEEMWNTVGIRLHFRDESKGGKRKEKQAGQSPPEVVDNVPTQGTQADRKVATSIVPDSSARTIPGAGRFTLLPAFPAL